MIKDLLAGFAAEQQAMSADVIRKAYQATEEGFFSLVNKQWPMTPQIAAVGSCCLVGVICGSMLYTANLGDSRVVLGKLVKATGEVLAVQLSAEHNAGIESVRQELHSMHPEDKQIVVLKHNVWRVKGLIQVLKHKTYRLVNLLKNEKTSFRPPSIYASSDFPYRMSRTGPSNSLTCMQFTKGHAFELFFFDLKNGC